MQAAILRSVNADKEGFEKLIHSFDSAVENLENILDYKKEVKTDEVDLDYLRSKGWDIVDSSSGLGIVGSNRPERLEELRKSNVKKE